VLQSEGIESHVVDDASMLTSPRRRRAKTDRIDGETLVRTLMAYKRGEPRVCSMARALTPQEEDRRLSAASAGCLDDRLHLRRCWWSRSELLIVASTA